MHHLLFYCCKFFRDTIEKQFPAHIRDFPKHFLSLSFADLTTYADRVQKAVSKSRRSGPDQRLIWLLERGVAFDGSRYLTEKQVAAKYRDKKHIMPHLKLGTFVQNADMVRIVPIEAPKNFTADLTLRKGSARDSSLPIAIKRTNVEDDYPHLTAELGRLIGKDTNWTAKAVRILNMMDEPKYHQAIRVGALAGNTVQRYSESAHQKLKNYLLANPDFNPYAA